MKLDFSKDLKLALEAAKEAGRIIKEGYGNIKEIKDKEKKGIVTDVDEKAEEAIIKILKANTDYSFIAEESGEEKRNSDFSWVIDPIDGTTNFSRQIPLICTSIALIKESEVCTGVIFNPITNELYYAEKGKGAFLNGEKISVSKRSEFKNSLSFVNYGYHGQDLKTSKKVYERIVDKCYVRRFGTTALELCYVAKGRADAFLSNGDQLYDFAAGFIIVAEAGGRISDWKGNRWQRPNSFILASNGLIHEKIVPLISDLQPGV